MARTDVSSVKGENLSEIPNDFPDNTKVDVDTVIAELGQFGPFQWKLMGLCAVVAIFASCASSEYIFTAARINTRCLIPECESESPEWYPAWVYSAIPPAPSGALDHCRRYPSYNGSSAAGSDLCPATLFNQSTTVACDDYVYEHTNTIVYDFDLACDEWRRTLVGLMRTIGILVALPVAGYVSDRWGRRVAISIAAFNSAWIGITRYWADTYLGFLLSELAEASVGFGSYTSAYILLLEMMSVKYRTVAATTMVSFCALSRMLLALIAWGVPNWKNLTLVLYIPQLVSIFYFWLAPESVRWYLSKGRYAESEAVLQKIAQTNGKKLNENSLEALRETFKEAKHKQEFENMQKVKEPWLIVSVFKHKRILLRCIVAPIWWISATFTYSGLSINSVHMTGNSYLNFVAVSAVYIPGYWSALLLVNRIGRKPVMTGAFWTCAACQVTLIFIPSDYYGLSLTFYLLGAYAIAIVMKTLYLYTAELYPTKHRQTLFAFTSMMGRFGSIIAPLTPAFGAWTFEEFPFVLFGSFALVSGFLVFLTPETLGTKLPNTMEEAENL